MNVILNICWKMMTRMPLLTWNPSIAAEISGAGLRADKPIVLLKGGKSAAGAKAVLSHTSSLAGDARLQDLCLWPESRRPVISNMMEVARALAMIGNTPHAARRFNSGGGAGILSCDRSSSSCVLQNFRRYPAGTGGHIS